ncbi:hypothetical protein [Aquabacterium sp.]|uniref:hypothetical protein n=1 Tax=Aquabacterium sp. TaxID=1872578 RepID=UPI0019B63CB9|nr:hypothetical protein [Aquabacterium sp.]MBC7700851.1 hypothetical protein [Aquabacterium sp.]
MLLSLGQLRLGDADLTEQMVLLRLVLRADVSPRELADHLAKDPALVSEVIRIAKEWDFPEGVTQAVAVLLRSADQVSKRHLLMSAQSCPLEGDGDADPYFAELERVFGAGQAHH